MNWKLVVLASSVAMVLPALSLKAEDAQANWDKNCVACHGKDGKGQTPMGKKLAVKDYTDAKVQADLKDEVITKAIKEGVKEGGKTRMKGFGDKLSDDDIKALAAHIRAFKK